MRSARTASKHHAKQPADIYGAAVLNITPFSDWFVCHRFNHRTVNSSPLDHVFGTGTVRFETYNYCNRFKNKTESNRLELIRYEKNINERKCGRKKTRTD